ncbi:MAG: DUF5615 family PIN-like protein [Chloroflexi bacterium]|nr:DUF5615 family PIN-like protein [Chloroflexota bacterium]
MHTASDMEIMNRAEAEGRVVLTADSDFAARLAPGNRSQPSLVLFRGSLGRRPALQADLIVDYLPGSHQALRNYLKMVFCTPA